METVHDLFKAILGVMQRESQKKIMSFPSGAALMKL